MVIRKCSYANISLKSSTAARGRCAWTVCIVSPYHPNSNSPVRELPAPVNYYSIDLPDPPIAALAPSSSLLLSLSSSSSPPPPPPACTTVHLANENSSGGSSCAHGPATKFNPVNRTLLRNFLSALARARISPFFFSCPFPLPPFSRKLI